MKFLNIVLANGAISEDALKTTRAEPISVSLNDMKPHVQENFLRKLQKDASDAPMDNASAPTNPDGMATPDQPSERVIFTCADDAGCNDSSVGKNCVDGFCVEDTCKDVKYLGVDPNPEACWLWKFPGDGNEGFYKRTTVTQDFSDTLPSECLFYRFHECSQEDVLYRTNPRNCEYELDAWTSCDHWETADGVEIGYARNRAVKDALKDNPKNSNGQTCWTQGSVPPPVGTDGQVAIQSGDQFWKNKLDGHCMGENMVKTVAEGGCGLTYGDWQDCKKWSGFQDIFPADKLTTGETGNKWLYAQIRGHTLEAAADTVLETGEVCEAYDDARRNIVREDGQGVQECEDPAIKCPKAEDPAYAYHEIGCCEYEFSPDFGACTDGVKVKSITKLLKSASGVPCYDDATIEQNKMNTEAGIRAIGWQTVDEWKGNLWETC